MMSDFTKGGWTVMPEEVDKPYIRIRGTLPGRRYKIANVLTPTGDGVPPREAEQTRANARLISAAPDLFRELEPRGRDWDGEPEDMIGARAALAKARGGV